MMSKTFIVALLAPLLMFNLTLHAEPRAVPYCAAVRGNGDSMPAHWGALAIMMETYGAPFGMAGGSSASVTTFLWESATLNPLLDKKSNAQQGRELALLFKSLEGVTYHLYEQPEWKALATWFGKVKDSQELASLTSLANAQDFGAQLPDLLKAIAVLTKSKIFYGPAIKSIAQSLGEPDVLTNPDKLKLLEARLQALRATISVFGKFDAKGDEQLFVREGLIDFPALARQFGALADFMSLRNATPQAKSALHEFFTACLPLSHGRAWSEIVAANPSCQVKLANAFDTYFQDYTYSNDSRVFETVGAHQRVLITTSVVQGESAQRFRVLRQKYLSTLDPQVGGDFQVASADLKFGYWGRPLDLASIQYHLDHNSIPFSVIDKSKRFLDLGQPSWMQVLSLSPAEPGLSAAVEFSSVGLSSDLISFGGWSDLSPVPALKMAGCEKVVYAQRRGGDALFAMGVAKRLLGFEKPDWIDMDGNEVGTHRSEILNNNGSSEDMDSVWSKLYNVRNPLSSYAVSIAAADAVVCTDWNAYDSKKQFDQLISTSYHAPIYQNRPMVRLPDAPAPMITKADNAYDRDKGYSPYVGCIPLQ